MHFVKHLKCLCSCRTWCNVQMGDHMWGKWSLDSGVAACSCSGYKIKTCSLCQGADDFEIKIPEVTLRGYVKKEPNDYPLNLGRYRLVFCAELENQAHPAHEKAVVNCSPDSKTDWLKNLLVIGLGVVLNPRTIAPSDYRQQLIFHVGKMATLAQGQAWGWGIAHCTCAISKLDMRSIFQIAQINKSCTTAIPLSCISGRGICGKAGPLNCVMRLCEHVPKG